MCGEGGAAEIAGRNRNSSGPSPGDSVSDLAICFAHLDGDSRANPGCQLSLAVTNSGDRNP